MSEYKFEIDDVIRVSGYPGQWRVTGRRVETKLGSLYGVLGVGGIAMADVPEDTMTLVEDHLNSGDLVGAGWGEPMAEAMMQAREMLDEETLTQAGLEAARWEGALQMQARAVAVIREVLQRIEDGEWRPRGVTTSGAACAALEDVEGLVRALKPFEPTPQDRSEETLATWTDAWGGQ